MKRWLRRILLACSLALILAAVGLTIRGMFAHDAYVAHSFMIGSTAFGVDVSVDMKIAFQMRTGFSRYPSITAISGKRMLPHWEYHGDATEFWMPHWLLFAVGSAYPTLLWLRHRKRKAGAGFPVELSASEPRVEASEAKTRPR